MLSNGHQTICRCTDQSDSCGVVPIYLSRACEGLSDDHLLVMMEAQGFITESLNLMHSCLVG